MSRFSGIGDFLKALGGKAKSGFGGIKDAVGGGNLRGILNDIRGFEHITPNSFSPHKMGNWFNTRIFGKHTQSPGARGLPIGPNSYNAGYWEANTGALNTFKNIATSKPMIYGALGAYGTYKVAGGVDRVAGFVHGGPDYGGYIGWGEGHHSERSALQGARTNMNYQAQMMGLQALSSNQIAPQYSLSIAPMRQRRSSAALRDSTQGLTLGLHKGRHGGY